jgi:tetratricopeptide (TPR) repeat protein
MTVKASPAALVELVQLNQTGQYAELLSKAIALEPSLERFFYQANAHYGLEQLDQAEKTARLALAIDPHHHPTLTLLASVANLRGDANLARQWLKELKPHGVDLPEARLEIAQVLMLEKHYLQAIEILNQSASMFSHPALRARCECLLADAYDGIGQYQEAYAHYVLKNEYARMWAIQLGFKDQLYEVGQILLDDLITQYPTDATPIINTHSASRTPIFIVGFPRSGTTLLQVKLEGLSSIDALEERDLWRDSLTRWFSEINGFASLKNITSQEIDWAREKYWDQVHAHLGRLPKEHFVDKFPLNIFKLSLIARIFPNAHVIYCKRNPAATIFSAFRRFVKPSTLTLACSSIASTYKLYQLTTRFMSIAMERLPLQFHLLQYEALMENQDKTFNELCENLGLLLNDTAAPDEWRKRLTSRPYTTPSVAQLMQGVTDRFQHQHDPYAFALDPILRQSPE